ncbi:MAG TPA: DUF4249 family protein [Ignavibacteriaceae bacterium]|jgi:hypothetical protein|nr:MAG: hypothetical protein BWY38_01048 [Ignavibacteria bacterium ADurb.Bin266]OQY75431.1 MAG: hypothetical protein B6D44_01620 [Ignavibacteriales bacterium UTCHB2]HQF43449.1 DUF4249 family protein [Ignavibacteriaceae bacterium]HQI39935.1 DUF4249 family protein [Ignavibacteriaceae bacterium]HQJ46488.1 DUF4249 family protein [Ignavibacteriaceae bacterium]
MKYLRIIIFINILLSFSGCDDSFNPYTDFKEKYSLVSILRSDTTLQIATITKNYLNEDNNFTNHKMLFEKNADVRIWYGNSVFRLRDTVLTSDNGADTIQCYYTKDFSITTEKAIEIEALLSNGKRLKAVSETPAKTEFKNTSEVIIPPIGKNVVQVYWIPAGMQNYYQPRLKMKCEFVENGINKIFYKELPSSVSISNGEKYPVYPKASRNNSVVYNLDAISWYLQSISDSLSSPVKLSIHQNLVLELLTFDIELSRYISISSSTIDNFSVRFDEGDYSNINGGLGIFGSLIKTDYSKLKFIESYIRSFKFNFIFDLK